LSVRRPQWTQRSLPGFFLDWRSQWLGPSAETMTPLDYIDEQKGLGCVVAAAWLFCPETIEYRDCIFLKSRFDQGNVDTWFAQLDGEQADVEAMVNQTRLYDVFASYEFDGHDGDLTALALAVGECWQGVLAARYGRREVTVEVSGEEDGTYGPAITFWVDHTRRESDAGTRVLSEWP
jgi:hypothetical protein